MRYPHPGDVVLARDWLRAGAPVVSKEHDGPKAVKTLMAVLELLPSLDARYAWGTDEWKAAMTTESGK